MIQFSQTKLIDTLLIIFYTTPKILRGFYHKMFLKKSNGLLFVGKKVEIKHSHSIQVGKNVKFENYSEIHGLSQDGLFFGNNVTIGRNTMIRPSSYYGGNLGKGLIIGDNSSIGPDGYVGCSGKIIIGKNVMLGPKCSLFAENHNFEDMDKSIKSQGVNQKGIIIEDNCWVGSNVIILDGVTIGKGSVIGAGTIITKDIPPYSIIIDKRNKSIQERMNQG